jgi:uncharacterized cupin superfamily protein
MLYRAFRTCDVYKSLTSWALIEASISETVGTQNLGKRYQRVEPGYETKKSLRNVMQNTKVEVFQFIE